MVKILISLRLNLKLLMMVVFESYVLYHNKIISIFFIKIYFLYNQKINLKSYNICLNYLIIYFFFISKKDKIKKYKLLV